MMRTLRFFSCGLSLALCSQLTIADTLQDIYELALQNDAQLKAAEASYRADLENRLQARSALLPQINAALSHSETDADGQSDGNPSTNSNYDSDSVALTLEQSLFDLAAWFDFKSGKLNSQQAEAEFAAAQQALIVRVAQAYFNVLRAQDNLEASRAEERSSKRQLEQSQQRFDVGLIAITEVHEARANYDTTVVNRLTDEGALGTALESLTVLTNTSHGDLWLLGQDFPINEPMPAQRQDWVDFALNNNFSLQSAFYAMEAARESAAARKMEHAPTVTGRIRYFDDDNSGDLDSSSDGTVWSINLNVPLYSGGRVSSQRRQAYERYNAALQTHINTQRSVVQNTRASHITVLTDVQRVKARAQAIVSTRSALEATQAGYEVGTRNIVDVLQAQRALYQSIRDYANSRYDYVINLLLLKQAAGTLSPQDVLDLNQWMVEPSSPTASQYKQLLKN